jgi:hypothetical protein
MRDEAEYHDQAVRPFVLTGGRARPSRNTIGVDTLLIAISNAPPLPPSAPRQARELLHVCGRLLSLIEAAAHLRLPVSVVTVLASDLVDSGRLTARPKTNAGYAPPERKLLREVLHGLRSLR